MQIFSSKILIRDLAIWSLTAIHHVQEVSHHRRQRNVLHHGAPVQEGIAKQQVVIGHHGVAANRVGGSNKYVAKRKCHSLAQLIWCGGSGHPPVASPAGLRAVTRGADIAGKLWENRGSQVELLVQISLQADLLHVVDIGGCRAEGGLIQQSGGRGGCKWCDRRCYRDRRCCRDWRCCRGISRLYT